MDNRIDNNSRNNDFHRNRQISDKNINGTDNSSKDNNDINRVLDKLGNTGRTKLYT